MATMIAKQLSKIPSLFDHHLGDPSHSAPTIMNLFWRSMNLRPGQSRSLNLTAETLAKRAVYEYESWCATFSHTCAARQSDRK